MDECVFCAIAAGKIPCHKIYEDERVTAFLDTAEDADGHTLVVPKRHWRNILDCAADDLAALAQAAQKIAAHYVNRCGYQGVNVFTFAEPCAGQSVFHLHFHIIPRLPGDGVCTLPKVKKCTRTLEESRRLLALC